MVHVIESLRRHFGHASFRPGQEALVRAVLDGRDVLAVMPTGSGKSLGFQLPAVLLAGTTIVVSPLIALMKDQVDELTRRGIRAAAFHSLTPFEERRAALEAPPACCSTASARASSRPPPAWWIAPIRSRRCDNASSNASPSVRGTATRCSRAWRAC